MRLFRKKYGGVIKALGLTDYWEMLTKEQRELIREWFTSPYQIGRIPKPDELDSPKYVIEWTSQTASDFLRIYAAHAIGNKLFDWAEEMLLEALRRSKDAIDTHFVYNDLIDFYYRQRETKADALELCEKYCWLDVELAPKVLECDWLKDARLPSFQRLAIIYEKRGQYDKAIEICERALALGLNDGTKTGFEGRIKRLKKKLNTSKLSVD